jgi:cell cycle checkpoint control protein RAD9A
MQITRHVHLLMQARLDASVVKHLHRALTCLSKYGDDLTIYATPEYFSLSTTNSSKTAYCRFHYEREFFTRYAVGNTQGVRDPDVEVVESVRGQLSTKVRDRVV